MDGYPISAAASMTGFTSSALRFYEKEEVVIPTRTASGYRRYRQADIEALRFVARSKRMGLSLSEIRDLLDLLDEDECEPVQTRLRNLIAERISGASDRIGELLEFIARLQGMTAQLESHTPTGPCDTACGCREDPAIAVGARAHIPVPIAGSTSGLICSLKPDRLRKRIDEWKAAVARGDLSPLPTGVRLQLPRDTDIAALARLAAEEQTCCQFFTFDIGIRPDEVVLDVTGPPSAQQVIYALFGDAA